MMAHQRSEAPSPTVDVGQEMPTENQTKAEPEEHSKKVTKDKNSEDNGSAKRITVKEEIVHSPEEKEFHIDDDLEQDNNEGTKREKSNLSETKTDMFSISRGEDQIQSWLSPNLRNVLIANWMSIPPKRFNRH